VAIITTGDAEEHFDPAEFDAFLLSHGTPAVWRKARTCPCLDPTSGQANINCPFCRDYPGLVWDAGVPITILAPGRARRDQYDQLGMWMQGMVTLTFPSTVTPGHQDQVEFLAAELVVNNERHTRGDPDPLGRSTERLRFPTPLNIEFCEAIVGADPDGRGGTLIQYGFFGDFTVSDAGTIDWVAGHGPAVGLTYTMRYTARPVYVCWSPMSRDEHATKQPYRVLAQRLDFFRQPVVGED